MIVWIPMPGTAQQMSATTATNTNPHRLPVPTWGTVPPHDDAPHPRQQLGHWIMREFGQYRLLDEGRTWDYGFSRGKEGRLPHCAATGEFGKTGHTGHS